MIAVKFVRWVLVSTFPLALIGCAAALAQGTPVPANVAADPVATMVGAGGAVGSVAFGGAGWWLGAKFERFMASFDKAIEVMEDVRDALEALNDDVAKRPRRTPRRTTAAS